MNVDFHERERPQTKQHCFVSLKWWINGIQKCYLKHVDKLSPLLHAPGLLRHISYLDASGDRLYAKAMHHFDRYLIKKVYISFI